MAKAKGGKQAAPAFVPASAANLPAGFKTKKLVTLPTLSLKQVGVTYSVQILDAMRVSQLKAKQKVGGKEMEPATVCTVVKLDTGEQANMLIPAVVKGNLQEHYPNDSYVGCMFQITNNGKRSETQRYNDFSIIEIEKE